MLDEIALEHHVSASQISTAGLCLRKWGIEKLDGVKSPPGKYAERGLGVHGVLEGWLDKGEPIDPDTEYGKIAAPGLKFLPPPGTGLVEQQFELRTGTAIYKGLFDLYEPPQAAVEGQEAAFPEVVVKSVVTDHKTTSDFKWMKLPEDLRKDPQANIYAAAAAAMGAQEHTHVELNWIYYRANASKPGARKVQLHVLPEGMTVPERPADVRPEHYGAMSYGELGERFDAVEQMASVLLDARRQGVRGADLEYNPEACNAFGGCPFRGVQCQLSMGQLIRGHMAQEQTLAERMQAQLKAKSEGTPAPAADAAAPSTPTTPTNGNGGDLAARMAAAAASNAASPEAKAEAKATTTAAAAQAAPPAVNPPESAKPVPPQSGPAKQPDSPGLRDQFAAAALQGLIAARDATDAKVAATTAYRFADAMLKAR